MDLSSILILDDEAARRLLDYYGEEALMGDGDPELREWLINSPEGVWFREILRGGDALEEAISGIDGRLMATGVSGDQVIAPEGMGRSLKGISIDTMNLGIHEYPFRISGPLDEIYTASVGRRLLM